MSSVWNLVFVAFERYLSICHPFKHQNLTTGIVYIIIIITIFLSFIVKGPSYFQTRLENGSCMSKSFFDGDVAEQIRFWNSIWTFIILYAVPCSLFCIFYGLVIRSFRMRQKQAHLGSSRVIDKANSELTKTAIVVTIIFIISIGWASWHYMLGHTGILTPTMNSPIQKIGVWFASFNSAANPFVYSLLMPAYRRSMKLTFGFICERSKSSNTG